jgi:hypothetical protein
VVNRDDRLRKLAVTVALSSKRGQVVSSSEDHFREIAVLGTDELSGRRRSDTDR